MDIASFSFPVMLLIFAVAGFVIWFAGIKLSYATDSLSEKFGLGEALGGLLLLAIVTNLPEIAIVVSASIDNNVELAIGNILGGIAIQTVVIVILDVFGCGKENSITSQSSSLVLVLEGVMVLAILSLVVVGHEMPPSVSFLRVTPAALLIFILWVAGTSIISKTKNKLPDIAKNKKPKTAANKQSEKQKSSTTKSVIIFVVCALATLASGVVLEITSNAIATQIGMNGVVFGATILAAVTALPEISTGFAAVWIGDYEMALSDIFGGNAFLPVLFLLASVCSPTGHKALPKAHKSDIYLTALGMLLTTIYMVGIIVQPKKQVLNMGLDSLVVLIVYILGIIGLFFLS
jgi:cation:H+ antiporter